MTGAVYARTKNLGLGLLEFNFPNWGDDENNNMKILDAAMSIIGVSVKGSWENSTQYNRGDLVVDTDTNTLWRAQVDNTSASTGTFADDRAAHPTYWADASGALHARGQWATATTYYINDVVYKDPNKYSWAMATTQFESSGSYDADVAAGNLVIITDTTQVVTDANAAKTAAQTSATNAASSATAAGTSATNASNSASAASTSATNAATSATNAQNYATNSLTYSNNASTFATNASNSASAASTSATNASTSATNAANSAAQAQALYNAMLPDAPADGTFYSRKDHTWQMTPGTMADAPSDGNTYGRRNASWVIGVGGGSTSYAEYSYNSGAIPPASGQIRFNNATLSAATQVGISYTTAPGTDIKAFMLYKLGVGSKIYIQDKDDSAKWAEFNVTSTATDNTTYGTWTVAYLAGGTALVSGQRAIVSASSPGAASTAISDTAPSSPSAGQLWWDSSTGNLYIYYNDGSSSQWVQVN